MMEDPPDDGGPSDDGGPPNDGGPPGNGRHLRHVLEDKAHQAYQDLLDQYFQ